MLNITITLENTQNLRFLSIKYHSLFKYFYYFPNYAGRPSLEFLQRKHSDFAILVRIVNDGRTLKIGFKTVRHTRPSRQIR